MGARPSRSWPRQGTSPTTDARSSSCSRTSSARRCRPSPSTTRPMGTPPRRPSSVRSSSRAPPRSALGGDIASVRPVSPAGWRVRSATPTVTRSPARLEVWEADDDGFYDVQYGDDRTAARGHLFSWRGRPYGSGRSPRRRIRSRTTARSAGCSRRRGARRCGRRICTSWRRRPVTGPWSRTSSCVVTHSLDSDAVFGVKDSLIRDFHRQAPGTPTPDGRVIEGTWSRTVFDVVLAPEGP